MIAQLIGIVRVSTTEQAKDGATGVARQEETLNNIAKLHGLPITIVRAVGVSGDMLAESPEWREGVVPYLGRPGYALAVDSLDRLNRPQGYALPELDALWRTRTLLYTRDGVRDLRAAGDYLITGLQSMQAGMDRTEIIRKMQAGKEVRRKLGAWVGPLSWLPTGCTFDRKSIKWGWNADAERVKTAYRMALAHTPYATIARDCGFSTVSTLKGILANPIYSGFYVVDAKQDTAQRRHNASARKVANPTVKRAEADIIRVQVYGGEGQAPALVSPEEWDRVQSLSTVKSTGIKKVRLKTAPNIPYTGFLISGETVKKGTPEDRIPTFTFPDTDFFYPHRLYGHSGGKHTVTRYICRCQRDKRITPKCGLKVFRAEDVNAALDTLFTRLTQSPVYIADAVKTLSGRTDDTASAIRTITTDLMAIEKQIKNLVSLATKGILEEADFTGAYDDLKAQKLTLESRLKELEAQGAALADRDSLTAALRESFMTFDAKWGSERKREWLALNDVQIEIDSKGLSVSIRVPGTNARYPFRGPDRWKDLLGYDLLDGRARMEARGLLTIGAVAARLGVSPDRVAHLAASGLLPDPIGRKGLYRLYGENQIPAIQAANANVPTGSGGSRVKRKTRG